MAAGLRGPEPARRAYRVEINAPSFKAFQQNGIVLRAGEIVRADATLSVGERTETVTVTGDPGVIQRESQAIQSGLDRSSSRRCPRGRGMCRASCT